MSSTTLKGELVLLVVDRGLTRDKAKIPLRDLILVEASGSGRERLMSQQDVTAGFADRIANTILARGIAVEDVYEPLPGTERPGTTPADREPVRRVPDPPADPCPPEFGDPVG